MALLSLQQGSIVACGLGFATCHCSEFGLSESHTYTHTYWYLLLSLALCLPASSSWSVADTHASLVAWMNDLGCLGELTRTHFSSCLSSVGGGFSSLGEVA